MNRIILMVISFFWSISLFCQEWQLISSISLDTRYYNISFPTDQTGYIGACCGSLLKTSDGGNTWQEINTDFTCQAIFFTTENNGYAADGDTMYYSTDGGVNWIPDTVKISDYLYDVYFPSSSIGYAVGTDGLILKYENNAWTELASPVNSDLFTLHFIDQDTGYVAGGYFSNKSIVAKTTDGGINWDLMTVPNDDEIIDIHFPSPKTGYAVGWDGNMIKTSDYGATWDTLKRQTDKLLLGVNFSNDDKGFICGNNGVLFKTEDGGASWVNQSISSEDLEDVYIINEQTAFATGYKTLLKFSNNTAPTNISVASNNGQLQIYPNPVSEILTIQSNCLYTIEIIDLTGTVRFKQCQKSNISEINTSILSPGIYLLNLINSSETITRKIIKK